MGGIIKAEELPENEIVFLKKDVFGWRVVEPIKTPDGKFHLGRLFFGGKRNFFILCFIFFLMFVLYLGFTEQINNYKLVADSPCDFCDDCQQQTRLVLDQVNKFNKLKINMSDLNITFK